MNRVAEFFDFGRIAVMKHLGVLESANLVLSEKVGRERQLWFNPVPIHLIYDRWTTEFSAFWAGKLARMNTGWRTLRSRSTRKKESPVAESRKAVFRIVIDGSIDAIFRELTKTDSPQGAVFNSMLTTKGLVPGNRMQMRTVSGGHTIVEGQVVEHDPPRRFAHTHRFTQFNDPVCRVVYDLKPVAGGVEVTLTVEDIPPSTKTEMEMQRGGMFILKNLKAIVETGRPPLATRLMYGAFGALEFVLPKKTRTEHWPL